MSIVNVPVVDPKRKSLGVQPVGKAWVPRGWWDLSDVRNPRIGIGIDTYAGAEFYADGVSDCDRLDTFVEGDEARALMASNPAAFAAMVSVAESLAQTKVGGEIEPASLEIYLNPPPLPDPES